LISIAHLNLHQKRRHRDGAQRLKLPHLEIVQTAVAIFLIIATLNLLLFIGACFSFSVQYQTNDDVAMDLYAAGKGLAQSPSALLLFQHFLIDSRR
jgi:hypothetical protein